MFTLSTKALKPEMILYEDVYSLDKQLLLKATTSLTQEKIQLLLDHHIEDVNLLEPAEVGITRYEHLHSNLHFQNFSYIYNQTLEHFIRIIRTLDTGLELNQAKLLGLRDTILSSVMNEEQLIDYLYNLMPNENEITYNHCFNCGILCYIFAKWLDFPKEELDVITQCGYLFDIGKTKIPDELLWKPDKFTQEEFIQMQQHIHLGYALIKNRKLPPHVISVMIMHHERCDGSGYPAKLKEARIDPYALLASIVDTYEAMTHPRAQRLAFTPFQAIRVFEKQGFEKYGTERISKILKNIANIYLDRRVYLSNGMIGKIREIHDNALSSPTIFSNDILFDLRKNPEIEIIRMM